MQPSVKARTVLWRPLGRSFSPSTRRFSQRRPEPSARRRQRGLPSNVVETSLNWQKFFESCFANPPEVADL
ncbi:hypothetical protein L596_016394 [Steinernema carpocapsae]|uniref:Uncharacterized protein n=1 Tax=Steinernema carpocapsae TaxID=34508 RepID=A0A4U5NJ15_STECR|nr:hypothetical protein L596_016394 [Steinernema carpocapsae]